MGGIFTLKLVPQSKNLSDYLQKTPIIDYDEPAVAAAAERLRKSASSETELIRRTYEFVRDGISHSADIGEMLITRTASEVLKEQHGICFAKSHLLAALLRACGIPAGLCYQKLRRDNAESALVLHGLNAVYVADMKQWIRLDARGNKPGVNAQFSLTEELLAFPGQEELGEADYSAVFVNPDANVLSALTRFKTREELWEDLPGELYSACATERNTP
jgi:transglutaminase-like putative cysteine protease